MYKIKILKHYMHLYYMPTCKTKLLHPLVINEMPFAVTLLMQPLAVASNTFHY